MKGTGTMNDSSDPSDSLSNSSSLKQRLLVLRILWAALLLGECMFLGIIVGVILPQQPKPIHPQPICVWVSLAMLLIVAPVTFAIRAMIFRRSRASGALSPTAYSTGNIIFWAGCDGVAFFGLVAVMVNGSMWPTILNVAAAMALQVITFPTLGKLAEPIP
jgi:hypothetical protein